MAERTQVATEQRLQDPAGERSAVAIRQDIAARREALSETVDKLGERIHETFDWHEYVGKYPAIALGLAAGAGFLIAGIFRKKTTPQERILDAVAELTEDMTGRIGGVMAGAIQKKVLSNGAMKTAAAAMITKAAVGFLKNQIAGATTAGKSRPSRPPSQTGAPANPDTNVQPSRFPTKAGS